MSEVNCRECAHRIEDESPWELTGSLICESRMYPFCMAGDTAALLEVYLHKGCIRSYFDKVMKDFAEVLCRELKSVSRAAGLCRRCGGPKRGRAARVAAPIAQCHLCGDDICDRHAMWAGDYYICTKCARALGKKKD